MPTNATQVEMRAMREIPPRRTIRRLGKGEVFGEIAMLTELKRTCSIVTYETCLFQMLSRDDIEHVKQKYPSLYDRIYDSMLSKYNDEDMLQKNVFVHNVPYFRGLEQQTIQRIVYLIKQQAYEKGSPILMGHMASTSIMIVWEGQVQARIERQDPSTGKVTSYWLDTLEQGACFSVFNCFGNSNSILNFYAASPTCIIDVIHVKELEELARDIIPLNDRLNVIKLRIKNKHVDDIDYFTFPKKMLQNELEKRTDADIAI